MSINWLLNAITWLPACLPAWYIKLCICISIDGCQNDATMAFNLFHTLQWLRFHQLFAHYVIATGFATIINIFFTLVFILVMDNGIDFISCSLKWLFATSCSKNEKNFTQLACFTLNLLMCHSTANEAQHIHRYVQSTWNWPN